MNVCCSCGGPEFNSSIHSTLHCSSREPDAFWPLTHALMHADFFQGFYFVLFWFLLQCYYIGATDDAATKIINEVSKPLAHHIPVEKICEKLKKKDSQICELKYGECDSDPVPSTISAYPFWT